MAGPAQDELLRTALLIMPMATTESVNSALGLAPAEQLPPPPPAPPSVLPPPSPRLLREQRSMVEPISPAVAMLKHGVDGMLLATALVLLFNGPRR